MFCRSRSSRLSSASRRGSGRFERLRIAWESVPKRLRSRLLDHMTSTVSATLNASGVPPDSPATQRTADTPGLQNAGWHVDLEAQRTRRNRSASSMPEIAQLPVHSVHVPVWPEGAQFASHFHYAVVDHEYMAMAGQDRPQRAPIFIHGGHGVLPYFTTWDANAGYPTGQRPVKQQQHMKHRQSLPSDVNNGNPQRRQYRQTKPPPGRGNGRQQLHQSYQQQQNGQPNQRKREGRYPRQNSRGLRQSRSYSNLEDTDDLSIRMAVSAALADAWDRGNSGGSRHRRHGSRGTTHFSLPPPQMMPSLPAVIDAIDDAPDLERFLRAATPSVEYGGKLDALATLTLADLWRFYEHSSAYGLECTALGGPRGPSNCYFVPYLSAVHLFSPVLPEASLSNTDTLRYPQGLDSWPPAMKRIFSWAATEHVAHRMPLHDRLEQLSGPAGRNHLLWKTQLRDLHPYSWFAVAWYPLYRIPDAPLTARFLTFHSLAPLWEAAWMAERQINAPVAAAVGGGNSSAAASVKSYKGMLESGTQTGRTANVGNTQQRDGMLTPTAVVSFPGSPFASEGAHTSGGGVFTSSDGSGATITTASVSASRSHSVSSGPATGSDSASVTASFGSSLPPSPAGSDAGDDARPAALTAGGGTPGPSSVPLSSGGHAVAVPTVGLCWHTAGSAASENWTHTLVTVDVPSAGLSLQHGDSLPGPANASIAGLWPGAAVVRKDYPLSKGGPLSWEIQLEELEEGARRLALSQGLVRDRYAADGETAGSPQQGAHEDEEPESCCPDYDFFSSRRR